MGFNTNIPSSEDDSAQLLNQPLALAAGGLLTFLALPLAWFAVGHAVAVIGKLAMLLVAGYLGVAMARFWMSKAFDNGLTVKEGLMVLFWPVDMIRQAVSRGSDHLDNASAYLTNDTGPKVLSKSLAVVAGVLLSIVALGLLAKGFIIALVVPWDILLLAILVYVLGAIAQFWAAQSWRDGLTENELKAACTWPLHL